MTAVVPTLKSRLADWRQWETNPVLLKELRQATYNQVLTTALMVLLTILFVTSVAIFARHGFLVDKNALLGSFVFRVYFVILATITLVFVPLFMGLRLALETREGNLDLLFITSLSPRRIVRGKLLCGICIAGMFFSVCMPFMSFANLLRGLDMPSIIVILVLLFESVCLAIQSSILFGCFPIRTRFKLPVGCLFTGGLVVFGFGVVLLCFDILRTGVPAIDNPNLWILLATTSVLTATGTWVLFLASVSFVTNDNRPRGYYGEIIKRQEMDPEEIAKHPDGETIQTPANMKHC